MLKRWSLANFKSFKGRTSIDLAPITVLAGANSSGKSSIIQSILLLKQTLQYVPSNRAIGLNGPLLKLGRFDDIKNALADDDFIEIGWELDEVQRYRPQGQLRPGQFWYFGPSRSEVRSAEFAIKLSVSPNENSSGTNTSGRPRTSQELAQLQPALQSVRCKVEYDRRDEGPESRVRQAVLSLEREVSAVQPADASTPVEEARRSLQYRVGQVDTDTEVEFKRGHPDAILVGASVRHFLPSQVGVSFNRRRDIARKITEILLSLQTSRIAYLDPEARTISLPSEVVSFVIGKLSLVSSGKEDDQSLLPFARTQERIRNIPIKAMPVEELVDAIDSALRADARARRLSRSALAESQDELETRTYDAISLDEQGFELNTSSVLTFANELAASFFQFSIGYLGPLRDEPKPLYPLEALLNPTDVGYRGEHTAAVLDLHRDTRVRFVRSAASANLVAAKPTTSSLHSAVVDWLAYLGVAEQVRTDDLGKLGHQMQVRIGSNEKEHDLTNVGVGVSQVLPILVMSLLAPVPSTLIFEQPELHLHPKVQARLADFFLSLGVLGKQCILETHSEYLVERLRLRIAESSGDSLVSKVKLYFTQKKEAQTVCKEVRLSRFGAILDWPEDFFDQAQTETESILRAAEKKLLAERGKTADTKK